MKIKVAKDAGYCFGVREAVKLAEKTATDYGEVYMLGHIVHNERVVSSLEDSGVRVIESLDDVPKDKPVLFRAHGTSPEIWEKTQKSGVEIIDATCPLVTEIHKEAKILEEEGYKIIIIGDHGHDEVIAIANQVKESIVVSTPEEAANLPKIKKAGIVTQSTQMIENVQNIIKILITKVFDLRFKNTICYPTRRNHEQIMSLAVECDIMLIIGSFTSANSKRLTQLSKQRNQRSYQVTSIDDIDPEWFESDDTVGITAGASTPDNVIEEVINKVKKIGKINNKEIIYE